MYTRGASSSKTQLEGSDPDSDSYRSFFGATSVTGGAMAKDRNERNEFNTAAQVSTHRMDFCLWVMRVRSSEPY